jgi:uncharacterized protein with PIN domain
MQKSNDPPMVHVDPVPGNDHCPKCGAEMEPIEVALEELPIQELHLCPSCYLVTWSDGDGPHFRQGVPMSVNAGPRRKTRLLVGAPEEC